MGTSSNEATILAFLEDQLGVTPAAAAGVLGNFQVESGFDPTQPNPGEGAIGIAQWEGGRRTQLQAYAAAHGGSETDLTMQLGYLAQELTGPYSKVLAFLRKTNDPAAAAAYFDVGPGGPNSGTGFENSSGDATQTRQADAQTIYAQIKIGALSGSGGLLGDNPPQYKPSQLHIPIPAPIKAAVIAWLKTKGVDASKLSDPALIAVYTAKYLQYQAVNAPITGPPNPVSGLFGWVTPLVVKSLFTAGGLGLAVLGMYAAAHSPAEA